MDYTNQVKVEWSDANGAWIIIGGGLPRGTCWSQHETEGEAHQEAREIADDLGCEFVH